MVEGHTDDEGEFDWNMELSADRAASVKSYLVEHFGIEADRMRTMGLGPTQPVDTNDTAEGRQKNRRVELVKF
jgi:outer membrane protein OmpA-like peptidoglycan-associated protein